MLKKLLETFCREVSGENAFDFDVEIYRRDRWSTFSKFHETAEYCARTLMRLGASNVEIVETPADGKTKYGDWVMPLAWDVEDATLEIVEPSTLQKRTQNDSGIPQEGGLFEPVLANWRNEPCSLGMWSAPTPQNGVEGEILELKEGTRDECEGVEMAGKIVLTHKNPREIKAFAAKKGALGMISDWTRNPDLLDATMWINGWGDNPGSWMMTARDSRLFCFSLSPRKGIFLRDLLRTKEKVRVKAQVESRLYEGTLPYVTGVIKGQEDEEVLVLGHLYEQGANDNAAGSAAILEVCRAINKLVKIGVLPQPKRSIRFLLMSELYGSMAYIVKNPERITKTLAALNIDTGAGQYDLVNSRMLIFMSPACGKSFVDALMIKIAESYFSMYFPWKTYDVRDFIMGTDQYLSEPSIGVPTSWIYVGMGKDHWHNSSDSLDKVDPRSLRDLANVAAIFLYFIANAGYKESLWIAEVVASQSLKELVRYLDETFDGMTSERDGAKLREMLEASEAKVNWLVMLGKKALSSIQNLVTKHKKETFHSYLSKLEERLDSFRDIKWKHFLEAAMSYAMEAGIEVPEKTERHLSDWEKEAASKFPRRKVIGTVTLDDIPFEEWKCVKKSPRWWGVETAAYWWADGKTSLLEIRDFVKMELGEVNIDLIEYFNFLEKVGRIEYN